MSQLGLSTQFKFPVVVHPLVVARSQRSAMTKGTVR
jgi:hypothetical protein